MKQFRLRLMSGLVTAVVTGGVSGFCDELVVNGNFALGNTGFSSDYTFVADVGANCGPPGVYAIGATPNSCHPLWGSFGPFDPAGNMMMVNGATTSATVWSETVSVVAGSTYTFSAYVASNIGSSPAVLSFSVNGTQVGSNFTAGANVGAWTQFSATWNSGASTTAVLKIVDVNLQSSGNDFSLDVISFSGPAPAAGPAMSVPHFAAGASYVTDFYVVNSSTQPANFSISFYDDNGRAVAVPFVSGASTTLEGTIAAKGSSFYETANPQGALVAGSAVISAAASITVQTLFRHLGSDGSYYEAAVPAAAGASEFEIPFDDTTVAENGAQLYTGIAIANMDPASGAQVLCVARDSLGHVIANAVTVPPLSPLGHWANYLFPALTGLRGTLDCSSNTKVGSMGLRALGANGISTLPVILPQ